MPQFVRAVEKNQLAPGEMLQVDIEGTNILLANVAGHYFAVSNICTHADCSLTDGALDGDEVTCPCHGAVFSVSTGEVLAPPANESLETYKTVIEGTDICISIT